MYLILIRSFYNDDNIIAKIQAVKFYTAHIVKGIDHQRTILSLVHKRITPMYSYLFIYNIWPEFAEFSSYTTSTI